MAAIKPLLCLSIVLFLCFNAFSLETEHGQPLDDDLAFLEQEEKNDAVLSQLGSNHHHQEVQDHKNNDESSDSDDEDDDGPEPTPTPTPEIDESDVFELKGSNFSEFVAKNRYVLVEFYAPWCGHCQALAPEYAAAATALKEEDGAVLAKIDATQERELAEKYGVEGSPTLLFFVDGVHTPYLGQRTKDAIVTWVKKKLGPGLYNVTTTEEAKRILTADSKLVLGFLDNLAGPESEELDAASKLEDNVNFYQTSDAEVAKLFHIDPQGKRPALVMIKKEAEKVNHFGGQFVKAAIAEFVIKNKLPLVNTFTRETASLIFESPIKKQLLLFATAKDSKKLLPIFQEAAKDFLGKLIFVLVDINNEDVGKPVSNYFGVTGGPRVIAYTGNGEPRKFVLDGEVTLGSIKSFAENVLQDKLKPFYKSDPVPKTNDGDVKIVVGKNFEEIVLDESKDVLLEIYAPWCGHCQALEPIYNKLAKYLRGIDSLVIAKMDGTANEHPRAKVVEGFPTLLFFPAGNKSFDPIPVDADRTVVAFYQFLKKHAAIPFKLQRPASTQKSTASDATDGPQLGSDELKDEL